MTTTLIHVSQWIMQQNKLVTRLLEGQVMRETDKAILFRGRATIEKTTRCLRCGRDITHPASQLVGVGPDCAAYLGIPYDREITPELAAEVKARLRTVAEIEIWIPKAAMTILRAGTPAAAPAPVVAPAAAPVAKPAASQNADVCTATVHDSLIWVKGPKSATDKIKSAGLKFNDPAAPWVWSGPATPFMAMRLRKYLPGLVGDAAFTALLKISYAGLKPKDIPVDQLLHPAGLKTKLWEHQLRCYTLMKTYPGAALHLDMGGGKSLCVVAAIMDSVINEGGKRFLIICPDKVVSVWGREFRKHADLQAHPLHIATLTGASVKTKAKRLEEAQEYATRHNLPLVVVVNYDSAWRAPLGPTWEEYTETGKNGQVYTKRRITAPGLLCAQQWDATVADEIHYISNPETKRAGVLYQLRGVSRKRYGLTGTPYTNTPLSVFGQMLFVEPGLFGTNKFQFEANFAVKDEWGSIVALKDEARLQRLVDAVSIRYRLDDVRPDMPEAIEQRIYATMPADLLRNYNELKNELYTEVYAADDKGTKIQVDNVLTKLLRLAQFAGGYAGNTEAIEQPDGSMRKVSEYHKIHDAKSETLGEWLDEIGDDQPAVVFCRFRPEIEDCKRTIGTHGRLAYELSGARNETDTWMASQTEHNPALWPGGKAPVIVAQIDSGAAGIDLTRCNGRFVYYTCYYSVGNRLVNYKQSRGRTRRPGTDERPGTKLYVTHILTEGTIDEVIMQAIEDRTEIIDAVLDHIRGERKSKHKKEAAVA